MRQFARTLLAIASMDAGYADPRARPNGGRYCRRVALALPAIVLAACATYTPAPIDPVRTADAFAARRLDAPALREDIERALPRAIDTWPLHTWDRAELLAVALVQNNTLAVAQAEVTAALAGEKTAGEMPNPTLGLQSEYARREPLHWLYGLTYDFVLRQRGVRALDVAFARLGTVGARAELMEKTWNVRRTLVGALSDRERARRRLDILARLAAAQDHIVALQQQRVAAGEDAPADLNASQALRIEIEQQQAGVRVEAATAEAALASALGMPPAALEDVAIDWPDWGDPPPIAEERLKAAREQALLSRADLAAAISDYAQTETKLERAVARQYPEVEFKPGYYWDHGIAKWPLDVEFALPIFNRNEGEIGQAKAARELAGKRMLALQAGIYGDIEAAARAEDIARANADAAEQRESSMQQQLQHAQAALRLGASDRMEPLGAEILLLRANLETVQARAERQNARNALEDALHAPLSGPELALAKSQPSADSGADR